MKFGVSIPHRGPLAQPDPIRAIIRKAEDLGYDVLTVSDHIAIPRSVDSRYPYTEEGDWPGLAQGGSCMEQLALLSYVAAMSTKARLLTSVMVIPHREPLMTAKSLATIDQLSGGRVILGCGSGWMREEFEALGTPPFERRGDVTDDYIRIFRKVWTEDAPEHESPFKRFAPLAFEPKPIQKPHPPVWIGGENGRARRRVAELGDGWYPVGANPVHPLDTAERYGHARDDLFRRLEKAGRDPESVTLAYSAPFHTEREIEARDGGRHFLTGAAADRAADIAALRDLGVSTLMTNLAGRDLSRALDKMQAFMEEVVPLVR